MADVPMDQANQEILMRLRQLEISAHDATDNALAIEKTPSALGGALRRATKLEDKEIDRIQQWINERAARGEIANIACSKGCWFCCTQMVAVTIPEVLRLADHIRNSWTAEQRADLDQRMASYMKATEAWRSGDHSRKPRHVCPLLNQQEGTCSVWLERPIVCRGYNSADKDLCKARMDDPVGDPNIPQIMGQFYAGMYSRTGLRHALKKHRLDPDLHEMIPALIIALEIPDAAERYLAGQGLFDNCKVAGRDIE